jgi:hypothetical protein
MIIKKIKSLLKIAFGLNLMEFLVFITITATFIGLGFLSGGRLYWGMAGLLGLTCPWYENSPTYGFPVYPFDKKELSSLISWSKASVFAIVIASLVLAIFCFFQKPNVYGDYFVRFCRQLSYGCFAFGGCFILSFIDRVVWSLLGYSGSYHFVSTFNEEEPEELRQAA